VIPFEVVNRRDSVRTIEMAAVGTMRPRGPHGALIAAWSQGPHGWPQNAFAALSLFFT
jgi:hypothetical protein